MAPSEEALGVVNPLNEICVPTTARMRPIRRVTTSIPLLPRI